MTFRDLKLISPILRALEQENYREPTPIQQQAIPPVLAGRDLLGCAQTGTGKTAAFAVPTIQRLLAAARPEERGPDRRSGNRPIRSLILTPTRELALQIYESFCTYGQYTGLRSCVIYGGVSQRPQEEALKRGVDILVATPGRLNDLIGQGLVNLKTVEILTLDEADRMLDMGFIHDVRRVLAHVPEVRQTLFFSATMPPEIVTLADSMLHRPVRVSITPESPTVEAIEQTLYFVDKDNKRHLLVHLLQDPVIESALVFTRTKHGADRVVKELVRARINAQAIHGNKSQNARQAALSSFKNRTTRVLVATDIAARGIDIDDLSHVINFDLPDVPESYVHRIGRTGRAGRGGIAISFCDIDEKKALRDIERLCARPIPQVEDHPWPMQVLTPTPKELLAARGRRSVPAMNAAQPVQSGRSGSFAPTAKAAQPPQAQPARQAQSMRQAHAPASKPQPSRPAQPPQAPQTLQPARRNPQPTAGNAHASAGKPPVNAFVEARREPARPAHPAHNHESVRQNRNHEPTRSTGDHEPVRPTGNREPARQNRNQKPALLRSDIRPGRVIKF